MSSDYENLISSHPLPPGSVADSVYSFLRELGVLEGEEQVRPLNRKDLLHLIKENGGSAEYINLNGLDMSRIDLRGLDLSQMFLIGCNLEGAIAKPMITLKGKRELPPRGYGHILLTWADGAVSPSDAEVKPTILSGSLVQGSNLSNSDFSWCDFSSATLARCDFAGADFSHANLEQADLPWAKLEEADFRSAILKQARLEKARIVDTDFSHADFQDANLTGAFISAGTKLETVDWGKDYINALESNGEYQAAMALYRQLGQWYEAAGFMSIASKFRYREMESRRKSQWKSLADEFSGLGGFWAQFRNKVRTKRQ